MGNEDRQVGQGTKDVHTNACMDMEPTSAHVTNGHERVGEHQRHHRELHEGDWHTEYGPSADVGGGILQLPGVVGEKY